MASPPPWSSSEERQVVAIGDAKFAEGKTLLVTHGLGTCIGVAVVNHSERWGGLLHFQIARSDQPNPENPYRFGDTGVRLFLQELKRRSWNLDSARWCIIGGASQSSKSLSQQIATANIQVARDALRENSIGRVISETGGSQPRTVRIRPWLGSISFQEPGGSEQDLIRGPLES